VRRLGSGDRRGATPRLEQIHQVGCSVSLAGRNG
jgi:hypothetical protein